MIKKRIISALLALSMIFSIMPSAFASTTYEPDNYTEGSNADGFDDYSPIQYLKIDYNADGGIDNVTLKPGYNVSDGGHINVIIAVSKIYTASPSSPEEEPMYGSVVSGSFEDGSSCTELNPNSWSSFYSSVESETYPFPL